MFKRLPEYFVILLSASLGYFVFQHFQMSNLLAEYQSYEDEYLSYRGDEIISLEHAMLSDIEDEVDNMGKMTNVGLRDTIQQLNAEMKALFRQKSIGDAEVSCWNKELNQIVYGNLREDLKAEYLYTFIDPQQYKIQAHLKWQLLTQYNETLYLLNTRLGVSCWWTHPKSTIDVHHQYQKGDTLYLKLGLQYEDHLYGSITLWEQEANWAVSAGSLEKREGETWWKLALPATEKEILLQCNQDHLGLRFFQTNARIKFNQNGMMIE